MSYSAVPTGYRSDDDDMLESPSSHPSKLQLPNFDFAAASFSLDTVVKGRQRSESKASKARSSIHSGTSYEMVDSDSESNYDGGESDGGRMEETGRRSNDDKGKMDKEREDEIASSGVLVSKFSSRNNAPSMQGGASTGNGNQQQHAQYQQQHQEHDHSTARGEHMHSQITDRLGLQLDGRADSNGRDQRGGGVSAHTSPQNEYQADTGSHNNDGHPRSPRRGIESSRPLPSLPPQPEFLDPSDPAYQISSSPDDVHPVFRHSQSVPELPPVDVESLHIQEDHDFRPATSASGVGDLFKDFDGVHFDTENPEAPGFPLRSQHSPLPPPPPAHHQYRQSQSYPRPQSHHSGSQASSGLVFYPAPVPAMLNLPPTLSKARPNNRNSRALAADSMESPIDNRRSVAYPGPTAPALQSEKDLHRRSVATLSGDPQLRNRRSLANLPPALRASQFFDSQLPPIIPDLKEESAVATLDNILDASTRASAVAFTDHPSSASYGHTRNRSNATQLGNYRNSVAFNVKLHPGESPRSSMDGGEHQDHHHYNHGDDEDDAGSHLNPETGEYYDPARFSGVSEEFGQSTDPSQQAAPTTLLAELESRKAQLRLRNRTAASAFPRGIRSTLLQLDAVAQVQQQHRRVKKTHLAWEEPDGGPDGEEKDEDVPLGLLFSVSPGVQKRRDEEVPLGLLMKKEMEDAEPLSKRRERLRQQHGGAVQMPQSMRMLDMPGLGETGEDEEVEGETLKQRMKRLKEKQQFGSGALDIDLRSDKEREQRPEEAKPEIEETLAQRRRRLQREREQEANTAALKRESVVLQQEVKNRRNMADILHVRPMGMARPNSFYSVQGGGAGGANGSFGHLQQGYGQGMVNMNMGMGGYGRPGPGLIGRGAGSMGTMGMGAMGMGGGMMGMGVGAEGISDPKQMEMVERWRASVM